uniref:Uncharacterized protein n=1 Tax=Opuntia streptacantha TaxID=393608 RepID=A0A7C9A827_OPUST
MVALASLPYPFVAVISYKARTRPRKLIVQSSIRVPSSPSKLTKRRNYLRPKILKTLTKPFPIPSPTPADPMTPTESVEPNVEVLNEPISEYLDSGIVEQSEEVVGINESDSVEFQVIGQVSEAQHVDFSWFSGRTVVRIVASFVGLFVLQTVAVWIMGSGDFDEKDKNLGIESRRIDHGLGIRDVEVGLDGDALGNSAGLNVDDSEIEAKIAEIRKMAREARELEKKSLENGEADTGYDSDDDGEGLETEASRLRSGIVKEVDRLVTKLLKNSPATLMNVKFLNKEQDTMEAKNRGLEDKDENDMLMFEMKHRFRSHLTARRNKPKGLQRIKGSLDMGRKPKNVDDEQLIKTNENQSGQNASSSDEDREINGLDSSFPERIDSGSEMNEKKSGTQSSNSLETMKKRSGCDSGARKLNKGSSGLAPSQALKKLSGSDSATEMLNKRINEDTKPEKG